MDLETITIGAIGIGVGAALMAAHASAGAAFGAIAGQILDWMPYFNHAIPEGIAYVGNAIFGQDAAPTIEYLQGNLDKVGAAAGFLGGFVRAKQSNKVNQNVNFPNQYAQITEGGE